jgi:DNA (cytosine-5)-methyltransferase 1
VPTQPRRRRPIAIDLFAGAGGLSLGFEQAGFDVVAALEHDPVHASTHLYNFPKCRVLCRDGENCTSEDLLRSAQAGLASLHRLGSWDGVIDAIIGGPPCQGFSYGRIREEQDPRNLLLLRFVDFVVDIRPRTFCLENVAGLLESTFDNLREEAMNRFERAGYSVSGYESLVNSRDFGVPQSRQRVIMLGSLEGSAPILQIGGQTPRTVSDALDGLASPTTYPGLLLSDEVELRPVDQRRRTRAHSEYARRLSGVDQDPGDKSRPRIWNPALLTGGRRTTHTAATVERFIATEPGTVESKSRLYRLHLDGVARTLRAGSGPERGSHTSPRPIHPVEPRVVTVREAARLHGYPDWFRFHSTNWHGHRQIGNSVPPPLARSAASALLAALGSRPAALRALGATGDASSLLMSRREAQGLFSHEDRPADAGLGPLAANDR